MFRRPIAVLLLAAVAAPSAVAQEGESEAPAAVPVPAVELGEPPPPEEPEEEIDPREIDVLRDRVRALEEEIDQIAERRSQVRNKEIPIDLAPRVAADAGVILGGTGEEPVGFELEEFRLGYGANLGRHAYLEAEALVDSEPEGTVALVDEMAVEAEFLHVLELQAGKFYTPVSWWGTNAPKGSYGFTPVGMPLALAPERDGGALPLHQLGAELRIVGPVGLWHAGAAAGAGNGRAANPYQMGDFGDSDDAKAVFARLWIESPGGLDLGVAGYYDRLSPRASEEWPGLEACDEAEVDRGVSSCTMEAIGAAHLVWMAPRIELVGEFFAVAHLRGSGDLWWNPNGYLLLAWPRDPFRPYLLADFVEQSAEDPFYGDIGSARSIRVWRAGLRYDVALRLALKAEVGWLDAAAEGGAVAERERTPTWRAQVAAGF